MRKNLLWIPLMTLLIFSLLSVNMIGITVAQVDHDIAVTSVTPYPTSVRLGEFVNVTVVVENQGTNSETFNVTAYYNNTIIGELQNVTDLPPGNQTTLTFSWNTTGVRDEIYATTHKEKTYTINATATIALDEDPDDNTLVSPSRVRVISQYIAVIPQSTVDPTLTLGENYTVSIYTDYNGSDIFSWKFILSYNPSVLHGVEVTNGDLITKEKDPSAWFKAGTFNNTVGKLSPTSALFAPEEPPAPTTSGPGILANVTFTVVGTGDSNITLFEDETELKSPEIGFAGVIINDILPYFGHILYGYFSNTEEPVTHDIVVVSVKLSPTSVVAGDFVNITVVVENQGTVAETFDVKVYCENTIAGWSLPTQTVPTIGAGANTSLTFTWDTTVPGKGTYTIKAVASTVPGETDTGDNTLESDETVTVAAREEQPLPIQLIIGVVVVVVAIGIVVYAVRRRKKPTPE